MESKEMRIRPNLIVSLLIVALWATMLSISEPVRASSTTLRFISDVNQLGLGNVIGQTFKVAAVVEDLSNLYALNVLVKWNVEYFRLQSYVVTIPVEKYPVPIPPSPYPGILHGGMVSPPPTASVNETTASISYASIVPTPFSGDGTVAVFTFKVVDQPLFPQNASFAISFFRAELADDMGIPIPHQTVDLQISLYGVVPFNIRVTNVTPYTRVFPYDGRIRINVTVVNEGFYPETFNLTLYANDSGATATFVIMDDCSANITYEVWGFIPGTYILRAYVWPAKGETNESDNTFVDGTIRAIVLGDVDGDGDVDILDVVLISRIYAVKQGEPSFDPRSDLDGDGAITILDLVMCTGHYGHHYP
jgi:hypothetical protein